MSSRTDWFRLERRLAAFSLRITQLETTCDEADWLSEQHRRQEADRLAQEVLLPLQKYTFGLSTGHAPRGQRRLRNMALAHSTEGKSASETARALRVTPRGVTQ